MKEIFYITVEGITSTVFKSQVLGLLKRLKKRAIKTHLLVGQRYRAKINVMEFLPLFLNKKTSFFFIKKNFNYDALAKKMARLISKSKSKTKILHCRNIEAAYIGLLIKEKYLPNVSVIYDVRGYVEGEKEFFNESERAKLFAELNKKLFTSNLYYSFVSEALYEVYNSQYKIPKERSIFCNSAYDDALFNLEKEKTVAEKPIKILFVGGNQSYQKIEEITALCKLKPQVQLVVITPKPINKKNTENIIYKYNLSQKKINELANTFDYGIIYRSSESFNKVATPTKITEYWGKGLKVIAINSAGAYDRLLKENTFLGFLVKSEAEWENIKLEKTSFEEKQKISSFVKKNLSLSKNVANYVKLYQKIAASDV